MSLFFIFTLLITAVSLIHKDDEVASCGPTIFETNCHQPSSLTNIMFSNLVKAKLPLLNVCFNRKLLPLPPSRPSFKLAILLLLAGDVSLNPGSFGSNERIKIATIKPVHLNFFDEFQDLLQNIISLHDNLYILGDFNLHQDNSNGNTNKFNEILTCFDLKQHVYFPTHVHGHWLDLLITKGIPNSIKSVFSAAGISDEMEQRKNIVSKNKQN